MSLHEGGAASPPYPTMATTSPGLYQHLRLLRAWVIETQAYLQDLVPQKVVESFAEPPSLGTVAIWENVGVIDKYSLLMYLRQIREGWDYILREHEDSWECKLALRKQVGLVETACSVLADAFVTAEVREMKEEQAAKQVRRQHRAFQAAVRKMIVPQELQENEESDEEPAPVEDADDPWTETVEDNE